LDASNDQYDWGIVIDFIQDTPEKDVVNIFKEIARVCKTTLIRIGKNNRSETWWISKMDKAGLNIVYKNNNSYIVKKKTYEPTPIVPSDRILVGIPTKDRINSLRRTLDSLNKQTITNFDVLIADDSTIDHIYEDVELKRIGDEMRKKGINVHLFLAHGINQADAHNKVMNSALNNNYKLVFRCDDDVTLQPDHLQRLFEEFVKDKKCEYSAMGGIILNPYTPPEQQKIPADWKNRIEFAGTLDPCVLFAQVYLYPNEIEYRDDIQHLYSSYMYRPILLSKVGGFPAMLSSVAYREETLGLYELYLQGYKMKIITKAYGFHWFEEHGGCRSIKGPKAENLYKGDDIEFNNKVAFLKNKYNIK
jgi:glycosyltransferase involved in cell wall biosynthesis